MVVAVVTPYLRSFKIWVNENKLKYPEGTKFHWVAYFQDTISMRFTSYVLAHCHEEVKRSTIDQVILRSISKETHESWKDATWQ